MVGTFVAGINLLQSLLPLLLGLEFKEGLEAAHRSWEGTSTRCTDVSRSVGSRRGIGRKAGV